MLYIIHGVAIVSLLLAFACALVSAIDLARRRQRMWIMNCVWPIAALFGSVLLLWFYWRHGRDRHGGKQPPLTVVVAKGALHCGAGCTLGDIVAEAIALLSPGVAIAFGWGVLFEDKMFAIWVLDYLLAFLIGIAFQYFTIAPMRNLGLSAGLWQALKADVLSLTAWQVGMYGFMAFAKFYLFRELLGARLDASMPEFWFMMQIAMLCGFVTSYPVNWWLIKSGVKEAM